MNSKINLFLWTQKACFSQILFTNLSKSVLVNEIIIHLTGVSYQDADYCTGVPSAGHNKRPLYNVQFYCIGGVWGGGLKTSQYLVWPPIVWRSASHLLHIELIRLLIEVCVMFGPLLFNGCVKLLDIEQEHAVVYADPEHPKHAQWVTCSVSMLAVQELGCFQLPGIVYRSLQHGAVHYHAATWGDGRGWITQQWPSGSRHGISVHSKCHQCP